MISKRVIWSDGPWMDSMSGAWTDKVSIACLGDGAFINGSHAPESEKHLKMVLKVKATWSNGAQRHFIAWNSLIIEFCGVVLHETTLPWPETVVDRANYDKDVYLSIMQKEAEFYVHKWLNLIGSSLRAPSRSKPKVAKAKNVDGGKPKK